MSVIIKPILAFKDNYIWCLIDEDTQHCIVVDPGEAKSVLNFLRQHKITLDAILITHHHWDHTNGIKGIVRMHEVPVYGPSKENILGVDQPVKEGDIVKIKNWPISFKILAIPGHTLDHIAYFGTGMVFCGDTLFSAGCGRIFEGTAEQMLNSLNKLMTLPDETLMYCGHEYTLNNLQFAQMVEPHNPNIKMRLNEVRALRQKNLPSLPAILKNEALYNPFLRCEVPEVISCIEKRWGKKSSSVVERFAYLRQWKNNFK